jgi:RND family efflux transporter MFP subunit
MFATNATAQVTVSFTEPFEQIDVSAAEFGLIQRIDVHEGQTVRSGGLLGELDIRVLQESRRLAKQRSESTARINAARADLSLKKSHYDKLAPLLLEGHANQSEIERAKSEYDQAFAALQLAEEESVEANIELARIEAQLSQRQIRSPIDGTVIEVHRRPGEYLSNNDPRFATVVQLNRLRARFFIATNLAVMLKQGDTVSVRIADVQRSVPANVEFVSPITDSQSGTVRVDVLIDNEEQQYRSGISCELLLPDAKSQQTLPASRVKTGKGQ